MTITRTAALAITGTAALVIALLVLTGCHNPSAGAQSSPPLGASSAASGQPLAASAPAARVDTRAHLLAASELLSTTGCTPLTDGGKCYQPGEYCREADEGSVGTGESGGVLLTLKCEDNDGWRWEKYTAPKPPAAPAALKGCLYHTPGGECWSTGQYCLKADSGLRIAGDSLGKYAVMECEWSGKVYHWVA